MLLIESNLRKVDGHAHVEFELGKDAAVRWLRPDGDWSKIVTTVHAVPSQNTSCADAFWTPPGEHTPTAAVAPSLARRTS